MPHQQSPVRWASRVPRARVRALYHTDALGIVDDDLIEQVGFGLYSRCQSILAVTAAAAGRVECPGCSALIVRQPADNEIMACDSCGWEMSWEAYHRTWQHQELYGGGAVEAFQAFVDDWQRTMEPKRRMLLIDRLIHIWHWQARQDHQLGRPAGVNLIEGSRAQVLALLDELSHGPASTSGLGATHDAWRATREQVRAAQRSNRDGGTSE